MLSAGHMPPVAPQTCDHFLGPQQTSIFQERQITDNVRLRQLMQACMKEKHERTRASTFLDLEKGFDRVSHEYLMEVFRAAGVDKKGAIKDLHNILRNRPHEKESSCEWTALRRVLDKGRSCTTRIFPFPYPNSFRSGSALQTYNK